MFGYIKPQIPELKVKEYELYRAVYCGLCAALGRNTTCVSRLSLSYDFVFLATVRMALAKEAGRIEKKRCLAHPTKKRAVLYGAEQLDLTARLSALLTYYKLLDDIADSKGLKRLASRLLLPAAKRMKKRAGFDAETEGIVSEQLSRLSLLEREQCDSVDRAAEPFGELMTFICSFGFEKGSREQRIAQEIGRHIGRFIYIVDALDDLGDDISSGSYNPFIHMYGDPAKELDAERIRTALTMELMGIETAVELMDFETVPEYGAIIRNIIYFGLPNVTEKVLTKNSAKAENGETAYERSL